MCALPILLLCVLYVFFFQQKSAYDMRSSDWSSDVCSSDLDARSLYEKRILGHISSSRRPELAEGLFFAGGRTGLRQARPERRLEERRVGKECVGAGRSGWATIQ